ncbi:hypothetical protein [Lacunimicrobium album]
MTVDKSKASFIFFDDFHSFKSGKPSQSVEPETNTKGKTIETGGHELDPILPGGMNELIGKLTGIEVRWRDYVPRGDTEATRSKYPSTVDFQRLEIFLQSFEQNIDQYLSAISEQSSGKKMFAEMVLKNDLARIAHYYLIMTMSPHVILAADILSMCSVSEMYIDLSWKGWSPRLRILFVGIGKALSECFRFSTRENLIGNSSAVEILRVLHRNFADEYRREVNKTKSKTLNESELQVLLAHVLKYPSRSYEERGKELGYGKKTVIDSILRLHALGEIPEGLIKVPKSSRRTK